MSTANILLWSLAGVATLVCLFLVFLRVHEKKAMYWRLGLSIFPALVYYFWIIPAANTPPGPAQAFAVVGALAMGIVLAVIWVPAITGFCGRIVGNLYDGGSQEIEAKPYYSVFRSKRSQGKYFEALAEVRRQLDRFPTDFEGQNLLADLQAENLNDLPGAEITLMRLCSQKGLPPEKISYVLNKLADWHLGITKDRESAQRILEKIIELMPGTEMALRAAQRIGHLANNDMLLSSNDRELVNVKKGVKNLGLLRGEDGRLRAPEEDKDKLTEEYVAHLRNHPLDTHIREKLAVLYVQHHQRLDLAADQLEQLIQQPAQSARNVIRWLNLLADLQVQSGVDVETVRGTLQRIIDLYPDIAAAENARRRIETLKLEARANTKGHQVKMGVYEQDIGLRDKK
jgi:tetratricopeptide (TPR) repeat protein